MRDALVLMAEWQETSRVVEHDDVVLAVGKSRFPTPYSNAVFPIAPDIDPERLFSLSEDTFRDRRYVLWSRGVDGGEMGRAAERRGFVAMGNLPSMVIERRLPMRAREGVEARRVTDGASFADFVRVSQEAYAERGLPPAITTTLLARPAEVLRTASVALATVDGEPAAAALSLTNSKTRVGGVYWVGTSPAWRRRGAGDAVTRAVTNAAFDLGASIVVLQASSDGEPMYARMGYRIVCRYPQYLSPKLG